MRASAHALNHDCLNFRHMIKPCHERDTMVSSDRGGDLGTALLEAPQVAHPERAGKRQWQGREMKPSGLNSLELLIVLSWKGIKVAAIAMVVAVCVYLIIGAFVWRDVVGALLGAVGVAVLYFGFGWMRKNARAKS